MVDFGTVIVAFIGVVGTLGGVAFGQWLSDRSTRQRNEDQRRYENATRFHAERVRVYALLMAKAAEQTTAGEPPSRQALLELDAAAFQVELLASPPVRERANTVHGCISQLLTLKRHPVLAEAFAPAEALAAYQAALDAFIEAARGELGTDGAEVSRLRPARTAPPGTPNKEDDA